MVLPQNIKLNEHINQLRPSATLAINERSAQLIRSGKTVYRWGFGQSPFPVPEEVVESLCAHAAVKDYLPVRGLPELREAVAGFNHRKLGIPTDADQVLIGPGSKELIYNLQMALEGVLLLPSPSWVSYEPQAHLAQKRTVWIETHESDGWRLTPEALRAACRELGDVPKILILNYPNNPVGTTYSAGQLSELADAFREAGILVVADEIYGELDHAGAFVSLAKFYPEGTI
ncbi:MAG: aminotransferase class I/II-fold pyridoxal phosphate-dependent enzyme, partial [Bacteroidetes bacterium]